MFNVSWIDYKGSGENPSILDLSSKYNFDELRSLVINGKVASLNF